jgi:hypothetical protein
MASVLWPTVSFEDGVQGATERKTGLSILAAWVTTALVRHYLRAFFGSYLHMDIESPLIELH